MIFKKKKTNYILWFIKKVKYSVKFTALLYGIVCHGIFVVAGSMMFLSLMVLLIKFFMSIWSFIFNKYIFLIQFPFFHSFLLNKKGKNILRFF